MENNNPILVRLFLVILAYLGIKYLVPNGNTILYPINLLVTFLHEFGHAMGAILTGGSVEDLNIRADSSGYCKSLGGNIAVILMGGYIGSAIFGNLLFYFGTKKPNYARITLIVLSCAMLFASLYWYTTPFTTGLLIAFSVVFILLAYYTDFSSYILMFIGLASILHIIDDFNVGPSSDLKKYTEVFGNVIPQHVWMYIWLGVVIVLSLLNVRFILKGTFNQKY